MSWVGFLLFTLVVSAIGLWGSQRIAALLKEEMVLHGAGHNRAVFQWILPKVRVLLQANADPDAVLAAFPKAFASAETMSMSLFLVDRRRERILVHTE